MNPTTRSAWERTFRTGMRDRSYEHLYTQAIKLRIEPADLAHVILERWASRQKSESKTATQAA